MDVSLQTVVRLVLLQWDMMAMLALLVAIFVLATRPSKPAESTKPSESSESSVIERSEPNSYERFEELTAMPTCAFCRWSAFVEAAMKFDDLLELFWIHLRSILEPFKELQNSCRAVVAIIEGELQPLFAAAISNKALSNLCKADVPFRACGTRPVPQQAGLETFIAALGRFQPEFLLEATKIMEHVAKTSVAASRLYAVIARSQAIGEDGRLQDLARKTWGLGSEGYRVVLRNQYEDTLRTYRALFEQVEGIYTTKFLERALEFMS